MKALAEMVKNCRIRFESAGYCIFTPEIKRLIGSCGRPPLIKIRRAAARTRTLEAKTIETFKKRGEATVKALSLEVFAV